MRRRGRVDNNQKEIVEALRKIGASVQILSSVGSGCPDILVGFRGNNYLFEIKSSEKEKLTEDENTFFLNWCGTVDTIYNMEQVLFVLNGNRPIMFLRQPFGKPYFK